MPDGSILLVGLGPGAADQMSGRARLAIAESDLVIGYGRYIDLIGDLVEGKEVIRKAMTQEVDRCRLACEKAREGRTVALVSSGDIGIYGMAGLTYEVLLQSGWSPGDGIAVEVIPGITALSACASLAGAPLGHDFCAISLSDLLTPWPVIARRLDAAGRGDFVVALYNPRSGRRRGQLLEAREILLRHRRPETPVVIVTAAYRDDQEVQHTNLASMHKAEIGMLSTVLIGNGATYLDAGLMITPRGYEQKYQALTGALWDGERAGRSLSLGLDGWRECVRGSLDANPEQTLEACARAFDVPIGWVLCAIAEHGADASQPPEPAGGWSALELPAGAQMSLIAAAREWGRIRITGVAQDAPAWTLELDADMLARHGDRIEIKRPDLCLSVDCSHSHRAWLARRGAHERFAYLIDQTGLCLIRIELHERGGRPDATTTSRFDGYQKRFARIA